VPELVRKQLLPADVGQTVSDLLDRGAQALESKQKVASQPGRNQLWVLDVCCGFRSRERPVQEFFQCLANEDVLYLGLDICPQCFDGNRYHSPDWCVDVGDANAIPSGRVVSAVATKFNLSIDNCIHVFVSTPCECNSPADRTNVNRGFGYRDWNSTHCQPLPASSDIPCPPRCTSQKHHDLAVLHDRLEEVVVSGILTDSKCSRFTFSFKNPAAMWTIDLKNGKGSVYEGKAKKRANLTLTMKASDFVDMAEGRLNGQQAFMAGKLKMKGNMGLAMKLGNIMATVQA